jgi:excisionase family DNA binding protein
VTGPALMTVPEVLQRLNVSRSALYALVRAGALPLVKLGNATRFDPADVEAFITRQKGAAAHGVGDGA